MKIATILVAGAFLLSPGAAGAQSSDGPSPEKPTRHDTAKIPRNSTPVSGRTANNSDRAIDAELKRIDRMMTICNGC